MTAEVTLIDVVRYRDKDGEPTCCADVRTGDVCRFLSRSRFGTQEQCALMSGQLERRKAGQGTLIPAAGCLVWVQR